MRGARVYFDFRGQVGLGKRLLKNGLVFGRARVVIFRNSNKELRVGFRSLKVRAVWRIRHESAAMEGGDRSHAIGHCRRGTKG